MIEVQRILANGLGAKEIITIPRAVDLFRSFVTIRPTTATNTNQGPGLWGVSAEIVTPTSIVLRKGSATATGNVSLEVVSCTQQEFRVYTFNKSFGTTDTTVTFRTNDTTGTPPVNPLYTIVVGSQHTLGSPASTSSQCYYLCYDIQDSGVVRITRGSAQSTALLSVPQVVEWAAWTGVTCRSGRSLVNGNLSSATSYAHGFTGVTQKSTWTHYSFAHQTAGLEQCSIQAFQDDNLNVEVQRRTATASWNSYVGYNMVIFPLGTVSVDHVRSTNSTTTNLTHTHTLSSPIDHAFGRFVSCIHTNSCSGTGSAFARNMWRFDSLTTSGGQITAIDLKRFFSGQTQEFAFEVANFFDWRPANPAISLGIIA